MMSLGWCMPRGAACVLREHGVQGKTLRVAARDYYCQAGVHGYRPKHRQGRPFQLESSKTNARINESNFYRLVEAYRGHGHKAAQTNPYRLLPAQSVPELEVSRYGLKPTDSVRADGILHNMNIRTVQDAVDFLNSVYCGPISAEVSSLEDEAEREWLSARLEQVVGEPVAPDESRRLAVEMLKSQALDHFLASKFPTFKRYGNEGAEGTMAFFAEIFNSAARADLQQIVLGMTHRGRLNLLTGPLLMSPKILFRKLKGLSEFPESAKASGDVISHLTNSVNLNIDGKVLHVTMLYNPSHLEAVNPVSMGKARGRQQTLGDGDYDTAGASRWSDKVLNVQVHGDAAFPGQGINQETLGLSRLPHFEVGGTVHLIVNNQLGFTTPNDRGSSSRYGSDLAKVIGAPVLHVSGDNPEMVLRATRVAAEYQRAFRKDVFVNVNCFRRLGHNEVDDPTFTNPILYDKIRTLKSVPDSYAEQLVQRGLVHEEEVRSTVKEHSAWLGQNLKETDTFQPKPSYFQKHWSSVQQPEDAITSWDTGVDVQLLRHIARRSVAYPEGFTIHPHLQKMHVAARLRRAEEGSSIDWAAAEAMAIGSLLTQGYDVRLSGQDVGRATFSHRHAMLVDQKTNDIHIPLNDVTDQAGKFEVVNSPLSEEAVLGYEYGLSIESPKRLVIWEAQFGDFFNGAQIIIDTFITCGETKWMQCSSLTLLLPHGYDGMGPEHSSCRLERFLQMTDSSEVKPDGDNINFHVANPTTAAQYFHLLRRQMLRKWRKPLVVIAPKIMIRMSEASSSLMDMAPFTTFQPVIGDKVEPAGVQRVVLVSGKHFYALAQKREELRRKDIAIVRIEELCPFPTHHLNQELSKYTNAKSFVWSQEEPRNMGAWSFVRPRIENLLGKRVVYSGRDSLGTPAVAVGSVHQQEAKIVIEKPFSSNL